MKLRILKKKRIKVLIDSILKIIDNYNRDAF